MIRVTEAIGVKKIKLCSWPFFIYIISRKLLDNNIVENVEIHFRRMVVKPIRT